MFNSDFFCCFDFKFCQYYGRLGAGAAWLPRGHDGAYSVEQQVSHASSLKQNHAATEHLDMSVDDWLEVEEEFFPEGCPVTDCS